MFDENELIKEKLEAAEDIIDAHAALHNRLEAAEEKETRSQVSNAAIHAAVHVVWLCQHTLAPALNLALAIALTPALAPALTLTLLLLLSHLLSYLLSLCQAPDQARSSVIYRTIFCCRIRFVCDPATSAGASGSCHGRSAECQG